MPLEERHIYTSNYRWVLEVPGILLIHWALESPDPVITKTPQKPIKPRLPDTDLQLRFFLRNMLDFLKLNVSLFDGYMALALAFFGITVSGFQVGRP